jgi:glutaconate CoA-transferase subunit B
VALLSRERTPSECRYVTSPGRAVSALVTDLGTFERRDGELALTAVPKGPSPVDERVAAVRDACGWDLRVAPAVTELDPPTADELRSLRSWDPRGWFLRSR